MTGEKRKSISRYIAWRFPFAEFGDAESYAFIALSKKPDLGPLDLKHDLMDEFRSRRWNHSDDGSFPHLYREADILEEDLPAFPSHEDACIDRVLAEEMLGRLSETHLKMISMYFYGGLTQKEIGKAEGVERSTVSVRITKALNIMREAIAEESSL